MWPVSDSQHLSPLAKEFEKMAQIFGYKTAADLNAGGKVEGFARPQLNIDAYGRRADVYTSFLKPVMHKRNNLVIVTHAQVHRILFNTNKQARGVEVDWHGRVYHPKASKEVIVSSGAIGSPFVLMHSGIGPAKELKNLGVSFFELS